MGKLLLIVVLVSFVGCIGPQGRYDLPCEIKGVTIKVVPDAESATNLYEAYGGNFRSDLGHKIETVQGFSALEEKVLVLKHQWSTWWEEITHFMDRYCLKSGRKKQLPINR